MTGQAINIKDLTFLVTDFNPYFSRIIDKLNYYGADRRFKIEGYPNRFGRRKEAKGRGVEESGPEPA